MKLFKYLIARYHYLGWSGTVGENLKYLIFDNSDRVLGCMMFGAAAWKVLPRDQFIGWSHEIRKCNLAYIANNNRFLILPWVKVPHLASHILGRISRRINSDWQGKYNHAIYLLETFVEKQFWQNGAKTGDIFMSIIQTCRLENVNALDYLIQLQKHTKQVNDHPHKWMPWNYQITMTQENLT